MTAVRGACGVIAALLLVFSTATPAWSDEPPPEWKRTTCTSGEIISLTTDALTLTVEGRLDCVTLPEDTAYFGFAQYPEDKDASLWVQDLRPYAKKDSATFFTETRSVDVGSATICIVTDYTVRIACFTVSRASAASPIVVAEIPTNGIHVSRTFPIRTDVAVPNCGTCWT